MTTDTLSSLLTGLRRDPWRRENAFSTDFQEAHQALHHPWATEVDRLEVLQAFCEHRQPCLFGRVAAKGHGLHFCILDESDIHKGDEHVASRIAEQKLLWKRRALGMSPGMRPPHAFLLVLLSPRIAEATPDGELRRLAERLRALAGWVPGEQAAKGDVASELLHLRNPRDGLFYGFRYNVDFFAAAGDGRWWHDHRFPGGLAFTANATGHMRYWREWYEEPGRDMSEWTLQMAMLTIANAHQRSDAKAAAPSGATPRSVSHDRITWLRDVGEVGPLKDVPSPLAKTPAKLAGKDWTTYEGVVHTDHSVRPSFFDGRDWPDESRAPYLMDFTYLYAQGKADHALFTAGVPRSREEVFDHETGWPETWELRSSSPEPRKEAPAEAREELRRMVETCRRWPPLGEGG